MKGILEKIVAHKKQEIRQLKAVTPLAKLANDYRLKNQPLSMRSAILLGSGVIAEFKRVSPSKGIIKAEANVITITGGYEKADVSAISVLTDSKFFGAMADDLADTRETVAVPILRKDFTIDQYQIYQAKIMGADCILLIASILAAAELKDFLNIQINVVQQKWNRINNLL